MQLTSRSIFLSSGGGELEIISEDGEVLASVAVPAGRVAASEYLSLVPDGASLVVVSGLSVVEPKSAFGVVRYGFGSHHSGANPDFRPTSASRQETEMRLTLARLQASTARLEARQAALDRVERSRSPGVAAPSDDVSVVE